MTSFKTLAAASLLSVMTATPVFAQAAIQEPGLFEFYHPNAAVLNGGAPTPEATLKTARPVLVPSVIGPRIVRPADPFILMVAVG
jgi:hypothetical protein